MINHTSELCRWQYMKNSLRLDKVKKGQGRDEKSDPTNPSMKDFLGEEGHSLCFNSKNRIIVPLF